MLSAWLIELQLKELGDMRDAGEQSSDKYARLQSDFREMLASKVVLEGVVGNRNMVYELIESHGDADDLVFFAELVGDFERVVAHYLQRDQVLAALEALRKQVSSGEANSTALLLLCMCDVISVSVEDGARVQVLTAAHAIAARPHR